MLRTGLRTSSDTLATSSSPPNATNTNAASAITSLKCASPFGKNGRNRSICISGIPLTMNTPIAARRINTMMSCAHAAALVPIRFTTRNSSVITTPLGMRGIPHS